MTNPKLIDGNTISDADPLAVQQIGAPAALGQAAAAQSVPVVLASDQSIGIVAPRKRARGLLTTAAAVIPIPAGTKAVKVYCSTLAKVGVGASASAVAAVQEQQTITGGDATSGNLTLGFQGQTSGNIAWNVSGANLVAALVAMSSIGAGGLTLISGGPLNTTPIVVQFAAGILDGDQPLLVPTTVDLAGGVSASSRLPVVTQTQAAVTGLGFVEGGTEQLFAISATDLFAYLTADSGVGVYRISFFS